MRKLKNERLQKILHSSPVLMLGALVLLYRTLCLNASVAMVLHGAQSKLEELLVVSSTPPSPPTTTIPTTTAPTALPIRKMGSTETNNDVIHAVSFDGSGTIVLDDGTGNEFKLIRNELYTAMEQYYSSSSSSSMPKPTTTSSTSSSSHNNKSKNKNNNISHGQNNIQPTRRTGKITYKNRNDDDDDDVPTINYY
eukprot:CAMPEP_0170870338 /NCGR_PEP_ID=MMETSP0734-20130129/25016_1 /TAXON_ID=186038 /ORGANISM="Fragilariopsis kerguelensis, Strain L26-C5" /LENGTH=194 /DNA_ID=CAMNT_0011249123 /DNA_START=208 /DNA_END=792 /DNA_ORIENTATION=-